MASCRVSHPERVGIWDVVLRLDERLVVEPAPP